MKRGFYWTKKAWYGHTTTGTDIMFGLYDGEFGGTSGEMAMAWEEVGGESTPQLRAYCDSWKVLATFTDLLQKMGEVDNQDITQEQFVYILLDCGFADLTPYESPYPDKGS